MLRGLIGVFSESKAHSALGGIGAFHQILLCEENQISTEFHQPLNLMVQFVNNVLNHKWTVQCHLCHYGNTASQNTVFSDVTPRISSSSPTVLRGQLSLMLWISTAVPIWKHLSNYLMWIDKVEHSQSSNKTIIYLVDIDINEIEWYWINQNHIKCVIVNKHE